MWNPGVVAGVATASGWLFLTWFVVRASQLGGTEVEPKAFQAAYLVGSVGYLLLIWVVRSGSPRLIPGKWRWWLAGCLALRAVLLGTAPGNDTYRYVWEGRAQAAGINPYVHGPEDPTLAHLRNDDWTRINHPSDAAIYPPLAQIEFLISASICPTVGAIKCWHAFCDFLLVAVLGAILQRLGRRPHEAAVYGLCPLVLTSFAIEGHLDSLMLLLTACSLWFVLSGRQLAAGALLGAAIATKLVVIVLLPWFFIRQWRTAALAVVTLGLTYLPFVDAKEHLFDSLLRFSGSGGMLSLLGTLGITTYESVAARALIGGLLIVIVIVLAWRVHDATVFGLEATSALLLLMPVIHLWYFSWALMFSALARGLRWITGAIVMVSYFEAYQRQAIAGTWEMPRWVGWIIWPPILAAWGIDLYRSRSLDNHGQPLQRPGHSSSC